MKTNWIIAIAILGMLLGMTLNVTSLPVVNSAQQTLFDLTLLASADTNPNRRQWAQITANSFRSVGINAQVQYLLWDICYDRCITPPPDIQRKTYSQGGYDIFFVGQTPGNPAQPYLGTYQYYFSTMTAPGSNMYWYNSSDFDLSIQTAMVKGYTPEGVAAFKQAQVDLFNDLPGPTIFYQSAVFAASNDVNFHGFDWIFDNIGPTPQFISGVTSFTIANPSSAYADICPPISNSWYDTVTYAPMFSGLFTYNSDLTITPDLATGYTASADGHTYTYTLRHGVTWHDGEPFTADDVVYTWFAYMDPDNTNQFSAIYAGFIGEETTFTYTNGTSLKLVLNVAEDGSVTAIYPADNDTHASTGRIGSIKALDQYTVEVKIADFGGLGAPVGIFHVDGEPAYIIPKHIFETIPLAQWKQSVFNTGSGSTIINGKTYTGPVGTGPYVWGGFDAATGLASMTKFNNYWNKTALEGAGQFTAGTYNVLFITQKDAAIASLKNNIIEAIDQNFQLQNDAKAGNLDFATVYIQPGAGLQQIAINLNHPVIGTGTATPLGIAHPERAAEAARYVRQALDYLIPKQLIIDTLLAGFGIPSSIATNPISPYFNTDCTAREYSPTKAKELLALAGYDTGVTPPAASVASAQFLVGQPITFTGVFNVDPVVSAAQNGFVNRLWVSYTNSTAGFAPVAMDYGTTGGYYELSYAPTQNGTMWYKVEMTGIGVLKAQQAFANGPTFQFENLAKNTAQQMTPVSNITVTTLSAVTSTATAPLQAQINAQNAQINSLNAALGTANTYAFVGIGIGIIALLVAIVAFMRKK